MNAPVDPIALFAPWADDEALALLRRIHRARDKMSACVRRSNHWRAREMYRWGFQLASDCTSARASADDLRQIIAALARTFLTAGAIERMEAPDEE